MALSHDRQLRHPALDDLPATAEITFPARSESTEPAAVVDDLAGIPASELDDTPPRQPAVVAPPSPEQPPAATPPLKDVSSSAPTENALLERAIRAEADATYAREYAKRLEEQLQRPVPTSRTVEPPPVPPDPMGDAFRKELGEAGVDPEKLDAYVLGRQESVFKAIRDRLEFQRDQHERVASKLRAEDGEFNEKLVDAAMAGAPGEVQRLYALGLEADRESALRFGWGMVKKGGTQPAAITPPAGNPRANMPTSQQRVSTPAPGVGKTWNTMNAVQKAALLKALGDAPDGSDEERQLLRMRFGGTSVDRVFDISGGAARSWE